MFFGRRDIFVIASASLILSSAVSPADCIASYTLFARSDTSSRAIVPVRAARVVGPRLKTFFPLGGRMPRVGVCKDRLADAIERFGRVPIVKRTITVHPNDPVLEGADEAPYWAAGGLVRDRTGRIVLLRHAAPSRWGDAWVTPGGRLEEGETTLDGFRRETLEEVGLEIVDPVLTRIFNEVLTDGARVRHGYFAQFVGRAATPDATPGPGVREVRWFEELPEDLAFREDYMEDFERARDGRF